MEESMLLGIHKGQNFLGRDPDNFSVVGNGAGTGADGWYVP
jgi:hypothetical protein